MKYFFSAFQKSFFPLVLRDKYEAAGTWPGDAVAVDESTFAEYSGAPPAGKVRGGDANGYPVWIDISPPTREERIALAGAEKQSRIDNARVSVNFIQTKLLMGRKLTDAETEKMDAILDYIDALEGTDITAAPEIAWPEVPADVA